MPIMQKNDVMKSQINMNKGTTSIWREIDIQNWTGENFKTFQEGRMNALSANSIMLTKRDIFIYVSKNPIHTNSYRI
jgi:hypothetical protein